jgi:transaldolase / glucose-6-phosphate isomerase
MNALATLTSYGQAFWLDYIRRSFIEGGEFQQMIERDGLRGVTSNPSIFEKAIAGSTDYADDLSAAPCDSEQDAKQIFERLAARDICEAADLLKPVYDRTDKADGYVSLEVSPTLAHNTPGTVAEARRLWGIIGRPNLMIKVPGTPEGLPAVETLLSEGINVNVTLLFSQQVYERTAETYLRALETRARQGQDIRSVASVASFFVSRIDTAVDTVLDQKLKSAPMSERTRLKALLGKAAIANAKLTYCRFRKIFSGPRWEALRAKGARPQRPLWASTSTKNPAYRDVLYVEELIGPDTVNTLPPATAAAFREHGQPRNSLEEDPAGAGRVLNELEALGISFDEVTDRLLTEGVELFASAFQGLLGAIRKTSVEAPPR